MANPPPNHQPSNPSKREHSRGSDVRLLLGAAVAVIIGGVIVAAAILAVTSGGTLPNVRTPQPFGLAVDLRKKVHEGGPINMAGLSGDDGFWVTLERDELVALLVTQPAPASCTVRWRGSLDTFTCDERPVEGVNLKRFRSFTSHRGSTKGLYMVALRKILPAPAGAPSTGG